MKKLTITNSILTFWAIFLRQGGAMPIAASLPAIKTHFKASMQQTQLTTTVFVLATCASQLIYGPLSDKLGRRKVLATGTIILCIGSICCVFALTINQLMFFRIIQGIGIGCEFTVSSSIISDMIGQKNRILAQGYCVSELIYGLSSIGFVLAGGFIQDSFGWQGNFTMLAIYSLLLASGFFFMFTETNIKRQHNTRLKTLFSNYFILAKDRKHILLVISMGMMSGFMYAFYALSPFYIQSYLKMTASQFGYFSTFMSIVYMIGVVINFLMLRIFKLIHLCLLGVVFYILGFIIMFVVGINATGSFLAFCIPSVLMMLCISFMFANTHSLILSRYINVAGTCNSQLGFCFFIFGATITAVLGKFNSFDSLTVNALILGVVGLFIIIPFLLSLKAKSQTVKIN